MCVKDNGMADNYFIEIEETGERYSKMTKEDVAKLSENELLSLQYDLRGVKSYFHTEYELALDKEKYIDSISNPEFAKRIKNRNAHVIKIYQGLCALHNIIEEEVKKRSENK